MIKQISIFSLLIIFSFGPLFAQRSAETTKRIALTHMKHGRYKEAIDQLNKYITYKPQSPEGYNLRALCYEAQKRYHYARLDYRRAISLDPSNPEYRNNLNRIIKIWYPILENKIEGYKRNIAVDPDNPFNYLKIGKAYREMEKWSLAEHWYDEYLKRDDNASPDEIIRFSIILQKTGHIKKGERILKKWVDRYPEDWRLWSRYGYFTLWLGNYKNAEHAFRTALGFKPFFKEAEDGLDLALRKAYVTQYQPDEFDNRRKIYPIDRYYRIVKRNPNNVEARFKLVNLLINKNRFEEAKQQLDYLRDKYKETERFKRLDEKIKKYLELVYSKEINKYLTKLKENPEDSSATYAIAEKYISLDKLDEAKELLTEYLSLVPDDLEARYLLARVYSSQGDKENGYRIMKEVINSGGNKLKYKLFAAQLAVWTLKDFDFAKKNLRDVVNKEPNRIEPYLALSLLFYSEDYPDSMKIELSKAARIDSTNQDYLDLKSMYELLMLKLKEVHYIAIVNKADSLMKAGNYQEAIPLYEEYLQNMSLNKNVLLSLGNAYLMNNDYDSALSTFDKLVKVDPSFDSRLLKAKVLFWSGDSVKVVDEFSQLLEEEPDNPDLKVYLGDSYFREHHYQMADSLYRSVPDSLWERYSIDARLGWLPPKARNATLLTNAWYNLTGNLFSYLFINPYFYYFNDNLGFTYLYGGFNTETGLLSFLSVGGSWRKGIFSDGNITNPYQRVMFTLNILPSKYLTISGSFGKMFSSNYYPYDRQVIEITANYRKDENFSLYGYYLSSEAVAVLYSPYLVPTISSTAHLYKVGGEYYFPSKLFLRGTYSVIEVLNNSLLGYNLGNMFNIRIGKNFIENVWFGYEFEYIDFQYTSAYYYSPQEFSSHSIFGEWHFYENSEWKMKFEGKVGYVPLSSFVIWDARAEAVYSPYKNLHISTFASLRQSQRYTLGYRSKAFGINVSWSVF